MTFVSEVGAGEQGAGDGDGGGWRRRRQTLALFSILVFSAGAVGVCAIYFSKRHQQQWRFVLKIESGKMKMVLPRAAPVKLARGQAAVVRACIPKRNKTEHISSPTRYIIWRGMALCSQINPKEESTQPDNCVTNVFLSVSPPLLFSSLPPTSFCVLRVRVVW